MTDETRQQIKQYETRPDSNYVSINAGTLEQIIDDALQAQRERLVSEIEKKYLNQDEYEERAMFFQLGNNRAIDEILNLINPPSN